MQSKTIASNRFQLTDADISELNAAHFSLRLAVIFLIVTIIIFTVMEFIKLICRLIKIRSEADKV